MQFEANLPHSLFSKEGKYRRYWQSFAIDGIKKDKS